MLFPPKEKQICSSTNWRFNAQSSHCSNGKMKIACNSAYIQIETFNFTFAQQSFIVYFKCTKQACSRQVGNDLSLLWWQRYLTLNSAAYVAVIDVLRLKWVLHFSKFLANPNIVLKLDHIFGKPVKCIAMIYCPYVNITNLSRTSRIYFCSTNTPLKHIETNGAKTHKTSSSPWACKPPSNTPIPPPTPFTTPNDSPSSSCTCTPMQQTPIGYSGMPQIHLQNIPFPVLAISPLVVDLYLIWKRTFVVSGASFCWLDAFLVTSIKADRKFRTLTQLEKHAHLVMSLSTTELLREGALLSLLCPSDASTHQNIWNSMIIIFISSFQSNLGRACRSHTTMQQNPQLVTMGCPTLTPKTAHSFQRLPPPSNTPIPQPTTQTYILTPCCMVLVASFSRWWWTPRLGSRVPLLRSGNEKIKSDSGQESMLCPLHLLFYCQGKTILTIPSDVDLQEMTVKGLESDERASQRYVRQIEELRDQLASEKEAACARERQLAKESYVRSSSDIDNYFCL